MGRGRPRRRDELFDLLSAAGFERPRSVRTRNPVLMQMIVAETPALRAMC